MGQASIFIKNLTILDAAVLDTVSGPIGRSWYVDVVLTGPKNDEGIVIDFSKAKRKVKEIIDSAFDHRLFVSEGSLRTCGDRSVVMLSYGESQLFALDTYDEALAVFPAGTNTTTPTVAEIEAAMANTILKHMGQLSSVKITLRNHEHIADKHYFNYTHSLRHHDGNCQRFHGHSNIVEVLKDGEFNEELSAEIARTLDGCYLISKDYLADLSDGALNKLLANAGLSKTSEDVLGIRYFGSQGEVRALVPKKKVVVMESESTIENISEFIKRTFLQNDPRIQVIAYEGIQKGALSS